MEGLGILFEEKIKLEEKFLDNIKRQLCIGNIWIKIACFVHNLNFIFKMLIKYLKIEK